jgi:hypothetical protein
MMSPVKEDLMNCAAAGVRLLSRIAQTAAAPRGTVLDIYNLGVSHRAGFPTCPPSLESEIA